MFSPLRTDKGNSKALSTSPNGGGHGVVDDNIARHVQVRDPLSDETEGGPRGQVVLGTC